MSIAHHPDCMCPVCKSTRTNQIGGQASDGHVLRATATLLIEKQVETIFTDNGITCIEDQAVEHLREQLSVVPWESCEIRQLKCYTHKN